jgi:hypothetical protein
LNPEAPLLEAVLRGLEESRVAGLLRDEIWLYPAVEVVHIGAFIVLVGSAFVMDLRLLGRLRSLPVVPLVQHLTRSARWSLGVVVLSGLALFSVDATSLFTNPAFRLKMVLLVAAVANAVVFHRFIFRDGRRPGDAAWAEGTPLPLPARVVGVLSLFLWFSVMALGRLIAYV